MSPRGDCNAGVALRLPDTDMVHVRVVGNVPVLMLDSLDERQTWLPFVRVVLCLRAAKAASAGLALSVDEIARLARLPYAPVHARYRRIFHHEARVQQPTLPYFEYRKVGNKEAKLIEAADFPGWERNDEGRIASFQFAPELTDKLRGWCHEFCKGRYLIRRGIGSFEHWVEAALARISV